MTNKKQKTKRAQYFVVTHDGVVYRAASKKIAVHAADICGGYEVTEDEVIELPAASLVMLYNRARPERPITKFRDRETASRVLHGVLDLLGIDMPSHLLPTAEDAAGAQTKARVNSTQPAKTKEQQSMSSEATAKKRGPKKRDIPQDIIDKIIALREKGVTWSAALQELSLPASFVHRVRVELKKINPALVKPLGPGSPNYGNAKAKRAEAKVRTSDIPQESF